MFRYECATCGKVFVDNMFPFLNKYAETVCEMCHHKEKKAKK